MDLGCLDLGCISVLDKHSSDSFVLDPVNKECDSREKVSSGSKIGKVPTQEGGTPILPEENQNCCRLELDGMNMTLDEALGDSNPHYSRVLREKIEAREAAN
ncbi:hypothetical protein NC651_022477 [Populus alba x Populus x berolinensis]|nr:hypothetical protein NC651_022477 [Populus alba x Populus x berolinensis]